LIVSRRLIHFFCQYKQLRYMASLHDDDDGGRRRRVAFVKGAPERVFEMCRQATHGPGTHRRVGRQLARDGASTERLALRRWRALVDEQARNSLRVSFRFASPVAFVPQSSTHTM
jgi:magnesium-transporting ATPase (P-type)